MKSFIFCTCYINEGNMVYSKKRYDRWIDYYYHKLESFNASHLFLIDDGSKDLNLTKNIQVIDVRNLPEQLNHSIYLCKFEDNLGRPFQRDYRGWWRSFSYSYILAEKYGFDKIIHIESDYYVTSMQMIDYIRLLASGWTAFYSNFFEFPESAIQIICKDAYDQFMSLHTYLTAKGFSINKSAELCLPFTHVEKNFFGDRFGEMEVLDKHFNSQAGKIKIDWIGQILPQFEINDFDLFFEFENVWR